MLEKEIVAMERIGDWFVMENGTYIRVYGATKDPHFLPRFILDKFVLQEVAYQTLMNGTGETLTRDNKLTWPPMIL